MQNHTLGQSKYLGMSRKHIIESLRSEGIEIMEQDGYMIHTVDDKTLCNIIFYFDDSKHCYHIKTTYQEEKGFLKLTNYFEMRYGIEKGFNWAIPFKNGIDSIKATREYGFDLIEETFHLK